MILAFIKQFYLSPSVLNFLKKPIIPGIEFIDWWMLPHFLSGIVLSFLLGENKLKLVFFILIGFEAFEYFLLTQGLVRRETLLNSLLDILVGTGGYMSAVNYL